MLPPVIYRYTLDDKGKEAYRILTDGLLHFKSSITLPYSFSDMEEVKAIVRACHLDHPELFYVNWWQYRSRSSILGQEVTLSFDYMIDPPIIKACWATMESEIANLKQITSNETSNEGRYKAIIRQLTSTLHYENTGNAFWDHTAAGPILSNNHTAVCEGIAKMFLLYCQHLNLPCAVVTGTLQDCPHAWNLIEYGGALRYIDVTSLVGNPMLIGLPLHMRTERQLLMTGYQWDASPFRMFEQ